MNLAKWFIIFHQPGFAWNSRGFPFQNATFWGPRSCDVAIIWPDICLTKALLKMIFLFPRWEYVGSLQGTWIHIQFFLGWRVVSFNPSNLILVKSFYLCNEEIHPGTLNNHFFMFVSVGWWTKPLLAKKRWLLEITHFQPTISSKGPLYTSYISNGIICDRSTVPWVSPAKHVIHRH